MVWMPCIAEDGLMVVLSLPPNHYTSASKALCYGMSVGCLSTLALNPELEGYNSFMYISVCFQILWLRRPPDYSRFVISALYRIRMSFQCVYIDGSMFIELRMGSDSTVTKFLIDCLTCT